MRPKSAARTAISLAAILGLLPLGLVLLASADAEAQQRPSTGKREVMQESGASDEMERKRDVDKGKKRKSKKDGPDRKTKKGQVMRKFAFEHLNAAHEAIGTEDYATALERLGIMKESGRLNDYERALMHQTYGYVYYQQDELPGSIAEFELALVGDHLGDQSAQSTRFNLAQLYLLTERLDDGIAMLLKWFSLEENPKPSHYITLANAYVRQEDYREALPYARTGIEMDEKPQQSWLRLLLSLELKFENYNEAIPVLEALLDRFPKKSYWKQLSALYVELDREYAAMTAYEMAYESDFLDESKEFVRLANMYLYHAIPYKAAVLLSKEIEAGRIEENQDVYELTGNCWISAQELDRALPWMTKAAEISEDGNLWMRLGQVYLEQDDWSASIKVLRKAIEVGDLDNPGTARLLLGISLFNKGDAGGAVRAFEAAGRYEKTEEAADQWIKHVNQSRVTGTGF